MDEDEQLGFGLSEVLIAPVPAKPKGRDADPEFCKFRDDVYATLHSQIKGYPDICELMRCYYSDTGHDPLAMAQKFGFSSFNEFITSDEMKTYVNIVASSSHEVSYHAAERKPFMHIRKEQMESFHNICLKRSQREGVCGAQRIRSKLFEVTRMSHNGMSFSEDDTATVPDILSRPGPAANRHVYDLSAWDGSNVGYGIDSDDSSIESWGERLCANVKPFTPQPDVIDIDWGDEEETS